MSTDMSQKGFTLVEVIVAMAILLLIAVAIAPMISQGFSHIFLAGEKSQAIHQAELMIRDKENWDEENPFPDIVFDQPEGQDERTIGVEGREISVRWSWHKGTTSITIYTPQE